MLRFELPPACHYLLSSPALSFLPAVWRAVPQLMTRPRHGGVTQTEPESIEHKAACGCATFHQHGSACLADGSMGMIVHHAKANSHQQARVADHCLWPSDTLAFLNQSGGMYSVLGL